MPGMFCPIRKVNLSPLTDLTDPVLTHIAGVVLESKHYLQHIRNAWFQIISFGAAKFAKYANFISTFELQGHGDVGSLT